MARNLKPDYIKKCIESARNGYKFDLANYLHNPAFGYEYPSYKKLIAEDELTETYRRVYYFKCYDGTGTYEAETFTVSKNDKNGWAICQDCHSVVLEESNRFSLKKLLEFCE